MPNNNELNDKQLEKVDGGVSASDSKYKKNQIIMRSYDIYEMYCRIYNVNVLAGNITYTYDFCKYNIKTKEIIKGSGTCWEKDFDKDGYEPCIFVPAFVKF